MQTNRNRGFSLVELLVGVAIMGVLSLALMTLVQNQNREVKDITDKFAILDLKTQLEYTMKGTDFCSCLFRGNTFNTRRLETPFNQQIPSVPSGYVTPAPPAPAPCSVLPGTVPLVPRRGEQMAGESVRIENIRAIDFESVGTGLYLGKLEVSFVASSLIRSKKPITTPFMVKVDTTGSPTAARFVGCSYGSGPEFRAYYNATRIRASGTPITTGPIACAKSRVAIHYGGRFIADNVDSTGFLNLRIDGTVENTRRGGTRSAGGGDITHNPETMSGFWSGPCAGTIDISLDWQGERNSPFIEQSYMQVQFFD